LRNVAIIMLPQQQKSLLLRACCCSSASSMLLVLLLLTSGGVVIFVNAAFIVSATSNVRSSSSSSSPFTTRAASSSYGGGAFQQQQQSLSSSWHLHQSSSSSFITELPDSLQDAAERAAQASVEYNENSGSPCRCQVLFDTSAGDETYTLLKQSTEFMQHYVSQVCYLLLPELLLFEKQQEMKRVAEAKVRLAEVRNNNKNEEEEESADDGQNQRRRQEELQEIIDSQGRTSNVYSGPTARIYFPDEGSAALARRDWVSLVPPCVQFSSCGRGVQPDQEDMDKDVVVFFFCPKASESDSVEELLMKHEQLSSNLSLIVFVNPNLVDMGVTGFGMAGRMLRERLLDQLEMVYYLRTLAFGGGAALTRQYGRLYSIWQPDENAQEGGYRLIATRDALPSNPEVQDIYDAENNGDDNKNKKEEGFGLLNSLGDFVNGMMKL
jgi:hypothetical protein